MGAVSVKGSCNIGESGLVTSLLDYIYGTYICKKSVVNFVFIDNTFLNIDLTVDGRDKTAALGIEEGGGSKITKL